MLAGIALGSNIEPRLDHIRCAVRILCELSENRKQFKVSSVYETEPMDCPPDSPSFLNAAVEIATSLSPLDLLARLQSIEQSMGRPLRRVRNSPRIIDLDLLYLDDLVWRDDVLTLPHPRIAMRQFVLFPLADICPDRMLSTASLSMGRLAAQESPLGIKKTNYLISL